MSLEDVSSSLQAAGLLTGSAAGLVPAGFTPTTALSVAYDGKEVALGNLFRANECKTAPFVSFDPEADAPSDACYTLMLVDADAPTPEDPKFAFWRHWVLPGLQPLQGVDGVVGQTKPALTKYLGPGPQDESKPHRYLFLLFREPPAMALSKEAVGGEEFAQRRSFDAAAFVAENKLRLVGVNWMLGAGDGWKE